MTTDKAALQKEVFHRVSNNFQIIQSMIRLVARDRTTSDKVTELEERIQLLSIAHHALHSIEDEAFHDIAEALPNLITGMQQGGFLTGRRVTVSVRHERITVQRTYAILHVVIEVLRVLERTPASTIDIALSERALRVCSDTEELVPTTTAEKLATAFARDFGHTPVWRPDGLRVELKEF